MIVTTVLDPGEQTPGMVATGGCIGSEFKQDTLVNFSEPHTWFPVRVGSLSSTWWCQYCRRVESRVWKEEVVADAGV